MPVGVPGQKDAPTTYVLQIKGARKSFSGVEVLHGVDLDLVPGQVHAVVGENGAGKSTLIKILSGVYRRDGGSITVDGEPIETLTPQIAHSLGIVTIYQERNLIPYLSVGENILLGDHRALEPPVRAGRSHPARP
jgi:ABC-type sugar transport system ATPase subunit